MNRTEPTPKEVVSSITTLTTDLVRAGLVDDQEWPALIEGGGVARVTTSNPVDASALRASSYQDLYLRQAADRRFNAVLLDKALLQLSYEWNGGQLVKHRLAFLPSPTLPEFQSDPDLYLGEHLWSEIVGDQQVSVPLRFDFDASAAGDSHPAVHLTLGQYKNCRIPVAGPITPEGFVRFILRHFYSTPKIAPMEIRFDADRQFFLSNEDHSGEMHLSSPGNR